MRPAGGNGTWTVPGVLDRSKTILARSCDTESCDRPLHSALKKRKAADRSSAGIRDNVRQPRRSRRNIPLENFDSNADECAYEGGHQNGPFASRGAPQARAQQKSERNEPRNVYRHIGCISKVGVELVPGPLQNRFVWHRVMPRDEQIRSCPSRIA